MTPTRLTAQAARELPAGAPPLRDHEVRGLELHAEASCKTWKFYYRNAAGQRRRPRIGHYPAVPLEIARKLARELAERVARGEDPSGDRQALRASPTVADLGAAYMAAKRVVNKPRSIEEDERRLRLHVLPKLGAHKVVSVTYTDISARLSEISERRGAICANRVRALLSGMFRFAEHPDRGWRPLNSNPCQGTTKRPEARRRRKIEAREFEAVSRELDRLEPLYPRQVAAIRVSLLAGTRITELVTGTFAELENGNTLIRADHKTQRTGEVREIVLPTQALAAIHALPPDGSGLLFGAGVDRFAVRNVWEKVRDAAGCPGLRLQDLRRTFASVALSGGISLDVIGQLFGHRATDTTRGYSWLMQDEGRAAAQATADGIQQRMSGGSKP